jgi:hypothetical protein
MGTDQQLKLEGTGGQRVRQLEQELKKSPDDKALREHIKKLKVAWRPLAIEKAA